jgi:hypothetical protein
MRRLTILILAAFAAAAFAGATAASALAVELPEFSVETGLEGKSGAVTISSSAVTIKCTSSTTTMTATSKKAGTFTMTLHGCAEEAAKCNTAGSESGVVVLGGEYSLVRLSSENAGALLLVTEKEATCSTLKVKIKGGVIAPITPIDQAAKEFELLPAGSKGSQEIKEYENEAGEKVKKTLEVNAGLGFSAAALETIEDKLTAAKETKVSFLVNLTLTARKTGGTAGGGVSLCQYTAVNQTCEITFDNTSAVPLKIITQELIGPEPTTRFSIADTACTVGATLRALTRTQAGGVCIAIIELRVERAGGTEWMNGYLVRAEEVGRPANTITTTMSLRR